MATATTTYDVKVKYSLDDKASRALKGIGRGAEKAEKRTRRLRTGLGSIARVAAVGGGLFGIKKAWDATIGFNRTLANTQMQLRTVLQLNLGGTFAENTERSSMLMNQLREDAKKSAGTFQEMVNFSSNIAAGITKAGGSMEDLRNITRLSVVAAAAFGERADVAALDIRQALAGTLGAKDRFAIQLGIDPESFNKLSQAQRLLELKNKLNTKAIRDAADAYQNSFEGSFSTFKSTIQEFGGRVGAKLFARLAKELQKANKWFEKNSAAVDRIANKLADGLLRAFEFAKKTFMFIIEHKELLLTLAKAFLVTKAAGGLAGMFVNFGGGLSNAGQALGKFAGAVGIAAVAAQEIASRVDKAQEASISADVRRSSLRRAVETFEQGRTKGTTAAFREQGIISDKGISVGAIAGQAELSFFERAAFEELAKKGRANLGLGQELTAADARGNLKLALDTLEVAKKAVAKQDAASFMKFGQDLFQKMKQSELLRLTLTQEQLKREAEAKKNLMAMGQWLASMQDLVPPAISELFKDEKKTAKKPDTKISKMVINVASDDPDRFAVGLEGLFTDLARNGAQAAATLSETPS